jgi:Tol biopolymer transport system component
LVYVPELPYDLVLVDRDGQQQVIADVQRRFHSPRFSPDGRRVAMDFTQQGNRDVWLLDLRQRTLSRISFDGDGHDPVWTPDGRKIVYGTARGGIVGVFQRNADGSGVADSLYLGPLNTSVGAFAPDGDRAITLPLSANGSFDMSVLTLDGEDRVEEPLLASPFNEESPALSPDGRWLAYSSDESGQPEVYVRPFPGPGAKVLVSPSGGVEPVWSRDGRELFYRGSGPDGTHLIAVAVETEPELRVGARTQLFDVSDYEMANPHANYDVSPDGQRFVMVHLGRLSEIVLIQNWTEDVRRRSAGEGQQ